MQHTHTPNSHPSPSPAAAGPGCSQHPHGQRPPAAARVCAVSSHCQGGPVAARSVSSAAGRGSPGRRRRGACPPSNSFWDDTPTAPVSPRPQSCHPQRMRRWSVRATCSRGFHDRPRCGARFCRSQARAHARVFGARTHQARPLAQGVCSITLRGCRPRERCVRVAGRSCRRQEQTFTAAGRGALGRRPAFACPPPANSPPVHCARAAPAACRAFVRSQRPPLTRAKSTLRSGAAETTHGGAHETVAPPRALRPARALAAARSAPAHLLKYALWE